MFREELKSFERRIREIPDTGKLYPRELNKGIQLCNDTLHSFRRIIERDGFQDKESEIDFFKKIKVVPMGYLVYFDRVRACESRLPKIGTEHQLRYLRKKMNKINRFFTEHREFVLYMEQGLRYLDHQYFIRQRPLYTVGVFEGFGYLDPLFFTSHDLLWSKINGMDRFIVYLQHRIREVRSAQDIEAQGRSNERPLVWSASKVALTELIYALYSSSVVNHGKEDIRSIAKAFEKLFNIKLDNIYKTYSEIKTRKETKARFLEELIYRFNQKIHDDDGI
ncbi:RteC domain-containing protein [Sediminicola luteus]|uniref:Tetracycline regulation of excision, RteC n=1 Tax=Sediminicola luteus TaxID=319238 RepID=A0A2A4G4V4_9FLAO|nr:RteC domain-containing protein [Sediminicola luteus]PCE63016.1 hypothetical protein B7P33_17230 [Sediminicola luteus]